MNKIYVQEYHTIYGVLLIGVFNNQLCLTDWKYRKKRENIDQRLQDGLKASFVYENHPLIDETITQLDAYFKQNITTFELPLLFVGTSFQKEIWSMLCRIPYGESWSYISLSRKLNNEKAIRAVAAANGANAISIIVPCHRIIGADGALTGYAGGISTKKKLLELEGIDLSHGQLGLFNPS
jgi:methylated-DNA-[protein]-cysteine S-methyltransferase